MSIEEFITKIRIHIREVNCISAEYERFLRDHFVFGTNSTRVRKECLKERNTLTLIVQKTLPKQKRQLKATKGHGSR